MWLVDIARKTSRKIYPSKVEFPARRDFRLAMAKRLKACEASPKCFEKQSQAMISDVGIDLNEDAQEFFYAPKLDPLIFSTIVEDIVEKWLFPPEPWTAPVHIAVYRKLLQKQPEVRFVDRRRFVDKFGETALTALPTQALMDWAWALAEK